MKIKELLKKNPKKEVKTAIRYKLLRDGLKSEHGNFTWKIGKWQKIKGKLSICNNGFHCSKNLGQAFSYIQGELVAEVEVRGKSEVQDDKEAWEEMKVVKVWKWQQKDSVEMAIFAAEQVIDIFEKQVPNDDRPRKAIEAAKKYLADPSKENKDAAARAARAARAELINKIYARFHEQLTKLELYV